jgi:ascorbate PTS system EIIA or EIIAB component
MPLPSLPDAAIALRVPAVDWRAAVTAAGAALAASSAARPGYAHEMIRMIEENGPYVVIAPGLALAHARPGPEVIADGLSVVTLAEPVPFGHPYNDPVRVVLGLAAASPERHLPMLAEVANVFNETGAVDRVAAATDADAVRAAIGAAA